MFFLLQVTQTNHRFMIVVETVFALVTYVQCIAF